MLDRRRLFQVAAGSVTLFSRGLRAQPRPTVKVRYNEVVRSVLYAPVYIAITNGYFKDASLDVEMSTANGGDKSMAALISGSADIALMGPEAAIYVLNSDSSVKARIFCGLTATDGFMLVGRTKVDKFEWSMLKGKDILGFRPGSTPLLFFEEAMRMNGVNPDADVKLSNNVAIPARVGSWLAGQNEYAIFTEPDASQLELDGKRLCAGLHRRDGRPCRLHIVHGHRQIHRRQSGDPAELDGCHLSRAEMDRCGPGGQISSRQCYAIFPKRLAAGDDRSGRRYQKLKIWKSSPVIEPGPIQRFEDILVHGHVLDADKRVKFEDLVRTEFASKAK